MISNNPFAFLVKSKPFEQGKDLLLTECAHQEKDILFAFLKNFQYHSLFPLPTKPPLYIAAGEAVCWTATCHVESLLASLCLQYSMEHGISHSQLFAYCILQKTLSKFCPARCLVQSEGRKLRFL